MARRPGGERGGAVDLDAEPRARARQERAVRDLWDAVEERRRRVRDERQLADPEVRAGEVELPRGGRGHDPERVVRGHQDVMRLAPPRDLAQLREPARDADVGTAVVDQVPIEQGTELP